MVNVRADKLPEAVIREASLWFVRLGAEEAGAADTADRKSVV